MYFTLNLLLLSYICLFSLFNKCSIHILYIFCTNKCPIRVQQISECLSVQHVSDTNVLIPLIIFWDLLSLVSFRYHVFLFFSCSRFSKLKWANFRNFPKLSMYDTNQSKNNNKTLISMSLESQRRWEDKKILQALQFWWTHLKADKRVINVQLLQH